MPDNDDLLDALALDAGAELTQEVGACEQGSTSPPPSTTALALDDWDRRRGAELLADSQRLQDWGLNADEVADFHGAAFLPVPSLAEGPCSDDPRREFVKAMLESAEYQSLHQETQLDALSSEIATVALAEGWADHKHRENSRAAEREEKGEQPKDDGGLRDELHRMASAARAVKEATRQVEEEKEGREACGLGPGSPGSNDPRRVAELFRRVRNSPALRKVMDRAGRFRRLARAKQRQKSSHGFDDMVGTTLGGEIAHLLPSELAQLGDEDLELLALRRLVERQALCREYQGVEPVARGPVVVVLDESGSMMGEKIESAKALALALAWVARQQNRWCGLIAFAGNTGDRVLALPPTGWDEHALCDWLAAFIGGGSDLDLPLRELPEHFLRMGAPRGKTDVIFVTDALVHVSAKVREDFLRWKREALVRAYALVVQGKVGPLRELVEESWELRTLDVSQEAVGKVLSI